MNSGERGARPCQCAWKPRPRSSEASSSVSLNYQKTTTHFCRQGPRNDLGNDHQCGWERKGGGAVSRAARASSEGSKYGTLNCPRACDPPREHSIPEARVEQRERCPLFVCQALFSPRAAVWGFGCWPVMIHHRASLARALYPSSAAATTPPRPRYVIAGCS